MLYRTKCRRNLHGNSATAGGASTRDAGLPLRENPLNHIDVFSEPCQWPQQRSGALSPMIAPTISTISRRSEPICSPWAKILLQARGDVGRPGGPRTQELTPEVNALDNLTLFRLRARDSKSRLASAP
jgi:hypothetical protein